MINRRTRGSPTGSKMMQTLRFAASSEDGIPCRLDLDVEGLVSYLSTTPGASVVVVRTPDLRVLLARDDVRRSWSSRVQHAGKGLGHYFGDDACIALEGKYTEAGRLRSALRKFLATAREAKTHLLGVSDGLFAELAHVSPAGESALENAFRGTSPEAQDIRRRIHDLARNPEFEDSRVLILGPSGSGKEVVARAIHDLGRGARGGEWVALNCAAISKELFEPELFGMEKGVVGGVDPRKGLWDQASGGTLFLDEVGELSLDHQKKLLRALEENMIRRVGGRGEIRVRARIIAGTNRDLMGMIRAGTFRNDLYYRLAGIIVRVSSLTDRGSDLEELAQHYWRQEVTRSQHATLSPEIIGALRTHGLSGGVRELKALLASLHFEFPAELTPSVEHLHETWRNRGDGPAVVQIPRRAVSRTGGAVAPTPLESLRDQVEEFEGVRRHYARFTDVLRKVLRKVAEQVAPLAIIDARTKSTASFAERIQRDRARFEDLRDLAGARIVLHTEDQIRDVCRVLEGYFEVEGMESMAAEAAPSAPRQGYAALRLAVRLDAARARALSAAFGVNVAREALGLWGEIEVRTVLEHAWAHVSRGLGHVDRQPLPARWHEELRGVARVLEAVDVAFARIHEGFSAYRTSFGAYLSPETKRRELEILTNVLAVAADPAVALRLGKIALSDGDWDRAIAVLSPHAEAGHQAALRDLGVAYCQKHRDDPASGGHGRGQRLLEQACAPPHGDASAWASLAGAHKRSGRYEEARRCYAHALELDSTLPYALAGLLEAELLVRPDSDAAAAHEPSIRRAIERCREYIEVGVNLPWALYDLGKFLLLLGERTGGLVTIARSIEVSHLDHQLRTSLESLERLVVRRDAWPGIDEARAIVAIGRAVKFPSRSACSELERLVPPTQALSGPVVFVVGDGAANGPEAGARRTAIGDALRGFGGTIVTRNWLQGWANVVASGIRPADVTVLADAADETTEVERRVAAALGAHVVDQLPAAAAAGF